MYIYTQRLRWFSKYLNNLPSSRSVVEFNVFISGSDVGMKLQRFFTQGLPVKLKTAGNKDRRSPYKPQQALGRSSALPDLCCNNIIVKS